MSVPIPPVPSVVNDPSNLYNGQYVGWALAWSNERFQDILLWLTEHTPIPSPTFEQDPVHMDGTLPALRVVWTNSKNTYTSDVWDVGTVPADELVNLKIAFGAPGANWKEPYPGLDLRYPTKPSPVGEPWPNHVWRKLGNTMPLFHPSSADNEIDWPVGAIYRQIGNGGIILSFQKKATVVSGTFWGPTVLSYVWELVAQ